MCMPTGSKQCNAALDVIAMHTCTQGACSANATSVVVTVVDSCSSCSTAVPAAAFNLLAPTYIGNIAVQLQQVSATIQSSLPVPGALMQPPIDASINQEKKAITYMYLCWRRDTVI